MTPIKTGVTGTSCVSTGLTNQRPVQRGISEGEVEPPSSSHGKPLTPVASKDAVSAIELRLTGIAIT
jgi:hypothetical protein